jgi:hypothetical protein
MVNLICGRVAQLGEHLLCKQGVGSSNLLTSTNHLLRVTATQRIFTARAASRATIVRKIKDWTIMPGFAQRDKTALSVGEKAVLVLKARNR